MQKYLDRFRDQADGHADDPLGSGAGAGEELHPDQDNASQVRLELVNLPAAPVEDPFVVAIDGAMIRTAARAVYTGHPHAHAAADRIAAAMESGTISALPLSDFERSVFSNCLTHLSRS